MLEDNNSCDEFIEKAVQLGNSIRRHRLEGNLMSVAPPSLYGLQAFVKMASRMPHLTLQQVALSTLLGNASHADQKYVASVLNEVFSFQTDLTDDPLNGGGLF